MRKKKTNSQNFRKIIRQIHLALGLSTGLVVFIVAVTGCCWVFQEEIRGLTAPYPTVEKENRPVITATQAREIAETVFPGRAVHGTLFGDEKEPVEVIFYEADPEFYRAVFLNPYSGEVLRTEDYLSGFFAFVLDGHMHLWLPEAIGSQIVGWSTLVFVLMLITGIVLWWPKNKRNRKQRFWFDWKATTRWKRKNYDLHAIAGFYASAFALIIALTGLVMTFEWFEQSVYRSLGGDKSLVFTVPENASGQFVAITPGGAEPIDRLIPKLKQAYPQAEDFEIHYPYSDSSSIYVEISYSDGVFYNSDYRFYDQRTLKEVATPSVYGRYEEAEFSDKVIRMNYDTHVGAILGLPGKILAFLASLIVASLPVTGFMVWLGRRKKTGRKRETFDRKLA